MHGFSCFVRKFRSYASLQLKVMACQYHQRKTQSFKCDSHTRFEPLLTKATTLTTSSGHCVKLKRGTSGSKLPNFYAGAAEESLEQNDTAATPSARSVPQCQRRVIHPTRLIEEIIADVQTKYKCCGLINDQA